MPRTIFDKRNKYGKMLSLLRGTALTNGKNYEDIGNMIGCSSKTVTSRFKRPETITLDELTRIGRGLNIPIDEVRQCIHY